MAAIFVMMKEKYDVLPDGQMNIICAILLSVIKIVQNIMANVFNQTSAVVELDGRYLIHE